MEASQTLVRYSQGSDTGVVRDPDTSVPPIETSTFQVEANKRFCQRFKWSMLGPDTLFDFVPFRFDLHPDVAGL